MKSLISETDKQKKIEKVMLDTAIKLAKNGTGSLAIFEIGSKVKYEHLFNNDIGPFNVLDSVRRYEILSSVDGAVIIDKSGSVKSYCAQILNTKPFKNFGTRHSAAYTSSLKGNISVLSSEEDRKVRVFKDGHLVMQLDPFEKDIEKKTHEAVHILESIGIGALGVIGVGALVPTLGITLIPGVIIFGSAHYLIKNLANYISDYMYTSDGDKKIKNKDNLKNEKK